MRVVKELAEIKLRLSRGQGLFYEVKNAAIIAASVKILFELSTLQSALLAILIMFLFYAVGYVDYRFVKLAQAEASLSTGKYNPHLKKIDDILKRKI